MAEKYYLETLNPKVNALIAEAIASKGLAPENFQQIIKIGPTHKFLWEAEEQIIQSLKNHPDFRFGHDWRLYSQEEEGCPTTARPNFRFTRQQMPGWPYSFSTNKIRETIAEFEKQMIIDKEKRICVLPAEKNLCLAVAKIIFNFFSLMQKVEEDKSKILWPLKGQFPENLIGLKSRWQKIKTSANQKKKILITNNRLIIDTLLAMKKYEQLRNLLEKIMLEEIIRLREKLGHWPKFYKEIYPLKAKGETINFNYLLYRQELFDGLYNRLTAAAKQIKRSQK